MSEGAVFLSNGGQLKIAMVLANKYLELFGPLETTDVKHDEALSSGLTWLESDREQAFAIVHVMPVGHTATTVWISKLTGIIEKILGSKDAPFMNQLGQFHEAGIVPTESSEISSFLTLH